MGTTKRRVSRKERLAIARRKRSGSAAYLRALEAGEIKATDILLLPEPPEALGSVRVFHFLIRVPGLGETKVRGILTATRVWPMERLDRLTGQERSRLITYLRGR